MFLHIKLPIYVTGEIRRDAELPRYSLDIHKKIRSFLVTTQCRSSMILQLRKYKKEVLGQILQDVQFRDRNLPVEVRPEDLLHADHVGVEGEALPYV